MDFHFGQKRFGVASVSLGSRGTTARRKAGIEPKHACAFSCDGGHCTEGRYHVCVAEHLRGAESARGSGKPRRGAGPRPLCSNRALVQTLDLLCNFTRSIYIVVVDVVVRNEKKREGLHVQ